MRIAAFSNARVGLRTEPGAGLEERKALVAARAKSGLALGAACVNRIAVVFDLPHARRCGLEVQAAGDRCQRLVGFFSSSRVQSSN